MPQHMLRLSILAERSTMPHSMLFPACPSMPQHAPACVPECMLEHSVKTVYMLAYAGSMLHAAYASICSRQRKSATL